jgi:Flp pilus assembly protein TadG
MKSTLRHKHREGGTALMIAVSSLVFLVPLVGLAVDAGFLYVVKARMQASVDGASLAAARALNLGQTTAAQSDSAKQNAVNWFYANYPAGNWMSRNTQMTTSDTHVRVYDDSVNPNLRHVDVMASSQIPTFFMKYLGVDATSVTAIGHASRRDVNAMLVLDRSGSMGGSCGSLISAAKTFTGQFSAGRDKIGAVSFADNVYLHSKPTSNFQSTLGYTNSYGTVNGELDTIACAGGTATPQAIMVAYNELYKLNQPGALNVIVVETDGRPNTITVNFWDGSAAGIASTSNCLDKNGKKKSAGGFATLASLREWTPGYNMNVGGTGYMANIPAGLVGGIGGTDSGTTAFLLFNSWTFVKTDTYNETNNKQYPTSTALSGCAMATNRNTIADLAWLPTTDIYGNTLVNGSYRAVSTSGGKISPISMTQIRAAAFNGVDSAGTRIRTNATVPAYVFSVGFTSSVDHTVLQRIANDPDWLGTSACTTSGQCVVNSGQPQGTYVFAATTADLVPAFLSLSSQILRLSR